MLRLIAAPTFTPAQPPAPACTPLTSWPRYRATTFSSSTIRHWHPLQGSYSEQRGSMAKVWSLPDAHAHPQDDMAHAAQLRSIRTPVVACMGVKESDWDAVLELLRLAPDKVIPCFGVHPWFAHLHSSAGLNPTQSGPDRPNSSNAASPSDSPGGSQWPQSTSWVARLEQLLQADPHAVVGECGLDRAAVIPGTKESVPLEHQTALVRHHLRLAGRLQRPISMHCVRATGAMQDLLRELDPGALPPRIMMHSFGGPPEAIRQMLLMKSNGVGSRLYFSFSSAINLAKGSRDKLMDRIRAVPEDRLLVESDQNSVLRMDEGLEAILGVVAEARGWSLEQAEEVAVRNFHNFYDGFLPTQRRR